MMHCWCYTMCQTTDVPLIITDATACFAYSQSTYILLVLEKCQVFRRPVFDDHKSGKPMSPKPGDFKVSIERLNTLITSAHRL